MHCTVVPTERLISVNSQIPGTLGDEPLCRAPRLWAGATLLSCVLSPLSHQLQFVLTIIQTSCGVIWRCAFPLGWLYFQIGYMISLIVLFTNFYIQVSLTLLWQLGFGMLSAKTLICSFKGVVWSPWCVRCTGLVFCHSDEAAPASGGPVTAGVGGTRSVPDFLGLGSMAGRLGVCVQKQDCAACCWITSLWLAVDKVEGILNQKSHSPAALNFTAKLNVRRNFHHNLSAIDRNLPFCPSFLTHLLVEFGGFRSFPSV